MRAENRISIEVASNITNRPLGYQKIQLAEH